MARKDGLGEFKAFNLDCDSRKYARMYDAAGFGEAPRLGRMVGSLIILPKLRRRKRAAGKKRSRK